MRPLTPRRAAYFLLGALTAACPVRAADDLPAPESALRHQAEEVQRLKSALEQAQAELKRLEAENARLQGQATNSPSSASAPTPSIKTAAEAVTPPNTPAPTRPAVRVSDLPPLEPDAQLSAEDLVRQFRDDPEGADARYRGRSLRVRGVVEAFDVAAFSRSYSVVLESPERRLDVRAEFSYLNRLRRVYTRQNGRELVGWIDDRSWRTLLRSGQAIEFRGTYQGFKDGVIRFTGATLVSETPAP